MARTPIATRQTIDPVFGEMEDNILDKGEFQSLIDLTSRTLTQVRFEDAEPNQLTEIPLAIRQLAELESQLREVLIIIKYLEEQVRSLQKSNMAIAEIPQSDDILAYQSGEESDSRIDLSRAQVPEEFGGQSFSICVHSKLSKHPPQLHPLKSNCDGGPQSYDFQILQYRDYKHGDCEEDLCLKQGQDARKPRYAGQSIESIQFIITDGWFKIETSQDSYKYFWIHSRSNRGCNRHRWNAIVYCYR